jgi:hypothetical protein
MLMSTAADRPKTPVGAPMERDQYQIGGDDSSSETGHHQHIALQSTDATQDDPYAIPLTTTPTETTPSRTAVADYLPNRHRPRRATRPDDYSSMAAGPSSSRRPVVDPRGSSSQGSSIAAGPSSSRPPVVDPRGSSSHGSSIAAGPSSSRFPVDDRDPRGSSSHGSSTATGPSSRPNRSGSGPSSIPPNPSLSHTIAQHQRPTDLKVDTTTPMTFRQRRPDSMLPASFPGMRSESPPYDQFSAVSTMSSPDSSMRLSDRPQTPSPVRSTTSFERDSRPSLDSAMSSVEFSSMRSSVQSNPQPDSVHWVGGVPHTASMRRAIKQDSIPPSSLPRIFRPDGNPPDKGNP